MTDPEKLKAAIAAVPGCTTEMDLLKVADRVDQIGPAEMNFPAEIIMYVDISAQTGQDLQSSIRASAERAMLQLAFFNAGEQPPCSFIMAAYNAGWRAGKTTLFERIPSTLL